ncbi:MAG: antibiotic biosynthesis monooxygenase [Acidimicrobiales bacterium]|nr:antibiotic biosynthesis monooxygenase [Acidimicrobiales bacterium]
MTERSAPNDPHPTSRFEPGQVVTVFRSRLATTGATPGVPDGYPEMADRMVELGTSMPGFVDFKTFTADDGERLAVITFADEQSQLAWRRQNEHALAQEAGRQRFYDEYSLQVCTCDRVSTFDR